jgi:hypothetical protein
LPILSLFAITAAFAMMSPDQVVPEFHEAPLAPLSLVATDAIRTELISMKQHANPFQTVAIAPLEELLQQLELAAPASSEACLAKDSADVGTCGGLTTKDTCDSNYKCKWQSDGGSKDIDDRLNTAKTAIDNAVKAMLDGLVSDYNNAKADLATLDTAIDDTKRTITDQEYTDIKSKATEWCTKMRSKETADQEKQNADTTLANKLAAKLSDHITDLASITISELAPIGESACAKNNGNAQSDTCDSFNCALSSRIDTAVIAARKEYLDASYVKFDKDAAKTTADQEESNAKVSFNDKVEDTAQAHVDVCGTNDNVHNKVVQLFNSNNDHRASTYRSLGVIGCHINHMKAGETFSLDTNQVKSGGSASTTDATNCVNQLKSIADLKTDLFPAASASEDSGKTCPTLAQYYNDIKAYGNLDFEKGVWQPTQAACDLVGAHSTSTPAAIPTGTVDTGQSGLLQGVHASSDGSFVIVTGGKSTPFRSTDGGATWSAVAIPGDDGANWGSYKLTDIDGSADATKLVGISSTNIFLSNDFGETWTKSSTTSPHHHNPFSHVAVSSDGMKIYVTVYNTKSIYWSHDGGATFTLREIDEDRLAARSICTSDDGSVVALGSWHWGGGIYVSTDSGATFSNVANFNLIPKEPITDGGIACSGDGSSLVAVPAWNMDHSKRGCPYTSHDTGQTWSGPHCLEGSPKAFNAYDIVSVSFCSGSNQNVVAASYWPWVFQQNEGDPQGVDGKSPYVSSDGGKTWAVVPNAPDSEKADVLHVAKCYGDNVWMMGTNGAWFGSRV